MALAFDAPVGYEEWLRHFYPDDFSKPLASFHREFWDFIDSIEAGVYQPAFVQAWFRGAGKCLDELTEVLLADGTRKKIRDIKVGYSIQSYNEDSGRIEQDRITDVIDSGLRACLRVTTRTRKSVTLTPEHRILTFDGWKAAGELTIADRIASPRNTRIAPSEWYMDEEVRFTAYLLAEGGLTGCSVRFSNADPVIVGDMSKCASALGFRIRKVKDGDDERCDYYVLGDKIKANDGPVISRGLGGGTGAGLGHMKGCTRSTLTRWVKKHGIKGSARTKRVPEWVFRLPVRQRWMFLAALIDTDGWVSGDELAIGLANSGLIDDIAYIFASVGVIGRIYHKNNKCAGAWTYCVDNEYLRLCSREMPLLLKGGRLAVAASRNLYSQTDAYPCSVGHNLPPGVNRKIRNAGGPHMSHRYDLTRGKLRAAIKYESLPRWVALEDADVFWDKVIKIEDAGEVRTLDVSVASNQNLITNLLVSHNSSSIEASIALLAEKGTRDFGLYVCSIQDQATAHILDIEAKLVQGGFEPRVSEDGDRGIWKRTQLQLKNFTILGTGIKGAIRGIKDQWRRPSIIFFDDIDDETDTPETVRTKIDYITRKILPAGSPDCIVCFLQNPIHDGSVMSLLLSGKAQFLTDRTIYPAVPALLDYEHELATHPNGLNYVRLTGGTPSWPEGMPLRVCQEFIHKYGWEAWLAECQHVTDRGGGYYFDTSWWSDKHPQKRIIDADQVPEGLPVCLCCDLAATQDGGDHTVFAKYSMNDVGIAYVRSLVRGQWSSEKVEAMLMDLATQVRRDHPDNYIIRIPQDPAQAGKFQMNYLSKRLAGFNVVFETPSGRKGRRAKPYASRVNLGNVYLVQGPWNDDFILEHKNFKDEIGFKGTDDQIDAIVDGDSQLERGILGDVLDRWASPEINDTKGFSVEDLEARFGVPEVEEAPMSPWQIIQESKRMQEGGFTEHSGWETWG